MKDKKPARLLRVTVSGAKPPAYSWEPVRRYTKKSLWFGQHKRPRYTPTIAYVESIEEAKTWLLQHYLHRITALTSQISQDTLVLERLNANLSNVLSNTDSSVLFEGDSQWTPVAHGVVGDSNCTKQQG